MKRIIIHFVRPIIENLVFISGFQRANLYRFIGYRNIGKDCFIGTNVYLDEVNPLGVCIGAGCTVTRGTVILSHYYSSKDDRWYNGTVFIGDNVFIGCNTVICKPVKIGTNSVIGACSVVNKDVLQNTTVAGNPIKIVGERKNDKI